MPVDRAIICATGFLKPHFVKRRGLVGIYHELAESVGPETKVGLYPWDGYRRILKDLQRWRPDRVYFAGHSYGGSLAAFVCQALVTYGGVRIPRVILTDPVWRPEIDSISKLSLEPDHQIAFPAKVERIDTWRQESGILTGHKVTGWSGTHIHEEVVTGYPHWQMDRLPQFRDEIFQILWGS